MKKIEEKIRKQIEDSQRLERERLESKKFRIFTDTENWVMITEWVWKKIRVIGSYVFKGYNLYWQAIFDQVAQYTPKED